jgi:hypothetical protein
MQGIPPEPYNPAKDIDYIVRLKGIPAFDLYFLRRLREKRAMLEESILRGSTTPESYQTNRALLAQLDSILAMPDEDLATARRMGGDVL